MPDSYHVGIRLLELKILPSLAMYFDGFFFTPFEVYKISTWVSCRFYFNFILYILFGLQLQRESLLKRLSQKMRSDHVYLSLHLY